MHLYLTFPFAASFPINAISMLPNIKILYETYKLTTLTHVYDKTSIHNYHYLKSKVKCGLTEIILSVLGVTLTTPRILGLYCVATFISFKPNQTSKWNF